MAEASGNAPGHTTEDANSRFRVEKDALGTVRMPAEHLWGAQTQRSLQHFSIGNDHMPLQVYYACEYVKKAAAIVNHRFGILEEGKSGLIQQIADEVISAR